jgi:hypothetical protein
MMVRGPSGETACGRLLRKVEKSWFWAGQFQGNLGMVIRGIIYHVLSTEAFRDHLALRIVA